MFPLQQKSKARRRSTAFPSPLPSLLISAFLPSTSSVLICLLSLTPVVYNPWHELYVLGDKSLHKIPWHNAPASWPCGQHPLHLASCPFLSGSLGKAKVSAKSISEAVVYIPNEKPWDGSGGPGCPLPPAATPVPAPVTPQYYIRPSWGHGPQRLPGFQLLKGIFILKLPFSFFN